MSHPPPVFEFDRRIEDRRATARRRIVGFALLWITGSCCVMLGVAMVRNASVDNPGVPPLGVFAALAPGWLLAVAGAAGAAFVTVRHWPVLPATSALIGLAPWAIISLMATMVIRGFLL